MTIPTEQRTIPRKRRTSTATARATPDTLRAQGVRTRNTIVRVARKLLLEGGSLEFSLRAVALKAGISISNLQYYFPTRLDVVRAVIQPIIDAYIEDLRSVTDNKVSPRDALREVVERALSDAKESQETALWWHFVSLASTDPECSRLLDEWYEALTGGIAQLIRAVNPQCKPAESMQAASLLIAMADGLALQLGAGRHKRLNIRGLDARFRAVVDQLIEGVV
jgi:AcrR family transcriptional regulator